MPDLPLPKPQPPVSTSQPVVSLVSNQSTPLSPAPISPQSVTISSPTTQVSPTGSVVSPQTVVPIKPPAVVTALSSVSSNKTPTLKLDEEEKLTSQSEGTNTSYRPTSAHSVAPPPTLADAKQSNTTESVPARGQATVFGSDQPAEKDATNQPSLNTPVLSSVPPTSTPPSSTSPSITPPPAQIGIKPTSGLSPVSAVTPQPTPTLQPTSLTQPAPSLQSPPVTQPATPLQSTVTNQPASLPKAPAPTPTASTPPTVSPSLAKPKKSPLKLIIGIFAALIGLVVIAAIVMAVLNRPGRTSVGSGSDQPDQPSGQTGTTGQTVPPGEQITIEYWGLWETSEVLNQVLQEFQTQNPGITVRYIQQSHRDFRERLQNAIVSGSGPDLFRFHASWVPMLANELEPMPASVMSTSDFSQTFYPVASRQLQLNGQLVGIPLMYEGLVLYYNQDVLETAGVQPPQSWSELRDAARTLSIKQENGQLQRGGVAIGTAENVDHFADILAVLMLQNGADLEQPNSPEGRDALLFYTNFVKQDQVWSADLPSSTVAFARGDVAMMFAPSWRAFEITQINPNLRFVAVTLPQLPNNKITWASYWAEGVSKQSQNKEEAWKLLQYLSQKDVQQKLFSAQSQTRAFGEPFSRVDLADQAASQPIVGPLLQDAPTAQGWYMSTFTHDNGINDQIIQYYKDAVNSLLGSGNIDQVLVTLQQGVNQVLSTYGVVAPMEPTPTVAQY